MELIRILLCTSTLLCSLVAGLLFTFAVIVMPGIKTLGDHDFLRAFQAIDRVIQNSQPLFVLVWVGSVIAMVATAVLGGGKLEGLDRLLIFIALVIYLLGVQLPTMNLNVPLNKQLQQAHLETMSEAAIHDVRDSFEPRWVCWNIVRTLMAIVTSLLLLVTLYRL